jgi:capsular polysaccharide biosynthesis protein
VELRRYLQIARRHWLLILITFLVTTTATAAIVLPKPWIYESTATWLLRSRIPVTNGDTIDATDVLNRTVNLPASFAAVARSGRIKSEAIAQLGPDVDVSGTTVSAEILTSTTILSLTVSGPHPEVNQLFARALGDQTEEFLLSLNTPFTMTPVDEPKASTTPVAPKKNLTIAMSAVLGLALGMALALFVDYLRRAKEAEEAERSDSGAADLLVRQWLRWERIDADRTKRPFSIAALRILRGPPPDEDRVTGPAAAPDAGDVRRIKELLRLMLPDDVAIGYLGDGEFAMIVPATELTVVRDLSDHVRAAVSLVMDGPGWRDAPVYLSSGSCEYDDRRLSGDAWVVRTVRTLMGGDASRDRTVDDEPHLDLSMLDEVDPSRRDPRMKPRRQTREEARVADPSVVQRPRR